MAPASAIYEGWVTHRRHRPKKHSFRYRLGMLYLDLDELPEILDVHPLWSARRIAPAWFRRADYLAPSELSLTTAVHAAILQQTGENSAGPVRLLTHPRYWGVGFNPVSFYFVFTPDGDLLRWVVADVSNTPWLERHTYVLGPLESAVERGAWRPVNRKEFHVSPFMEMDMQYRWLLRPPATELLVGIENHDHEGRLFDATLSLSRRPLDRHNLGRLLWRYPWQSAKVVTAIYWQALRLWTKRLPYIPHPGSRREATE